MGERAAVMGVLAAVMGVLAAVMGVLAVVMRGVQDSCLEDIMLTRKD